MDTMGLAVIKEYIEGIGLNIPGVLFKSRDGKTGLSVTARKEEYKMKPTEIGDEIRRLLGIEQYEDAFENVPVLPLVDSDVRDYILAEKIQTLNLTDLTPTQYMAVFLVLATDYFGDLKTKFASMISETLEADENATTISTLSQGIISALRHAIAIRLISPELSDIYGRQGRRSLEVFTPKYITSLTEKLTDEVDPIRFLRELIQPAE